LFHRRFLWQWFWLLEDEINGKLCCMVMLKLQNFRSRFLYPSWISVFLWVLLVFLRSVLLRCFRSLLRYLFWIFLTFPVNLSEISFGFASSLIWAHGVLYELNCFVKLFLSSSESVFVVWSSVFMPLSSIAWIWWKLLN